MANPIIREDKNYDLAGIKLKPDQQEAVDFLLRRFNVILGLQT